MRVFRGLITMWVVRNMRWMLVFALAFAFAESAQEASAQELERVTVAESVHEVYARGTHAGARRAFEGRPVAFREWNCDERDDQAACVRAYGTRVVRVDVHQRRVACVPIYGSNGRRSGHRQIVRPVVLIEVYSTDGSLIDTSPPREVHPDENLATVVEESIRAFEAAQAA